MLENIIFLRKSFAGAYRVGAAEYFALSVLIYFKEEIMSELYNHKVIEKKWQDIWDEKKAFAATCDYSKPKFYALVEFPYPSGQGLHVGHPRPYTALDIVARKRRMQGYNVLYPMGWDAFGLPTENYAIKNKVHPKVVTANNVHALRNSCIRSAIPSTGTER